MGCCACPLLRARILLSRQCAHQLCYNGVTITQKVDDVSAVAQQLGTWVRRCVVPLGDRPRGPCGVSAALLLYPSAAGERRESCAAVAVAFPFDC